MRLRECSAASLFYFRQKRSHNERMSRNRSESLLLYNNFRYSRSGAKYGKIKSTNCFLRNVNEWLTAKERGYRADTTPYANLEEPPGGVVRCGYCIAFPVTLYHKRYHAVVGS